VLDVSACRATGAICPETDDESLILSHGEISERVPCARAPSVLSVGTDRAVAVHGYSAMNVRIASPILI
jgi:hypothetical protein